MRTVSSLWNGDARGLSTARVTDFKALSSSDAGGTGSRNRRRPRRVRSAAIAAAGAETQTQGVQLDEALGIALVVDLIGLEGRKGLVIEALR